MQKAAIYLLIAIISAVLGFSFAKFCPLASPKGASASAATSAPNANTALVNEVQTIRSQLELYKLQHADKYPDFRKYGWKQLTYKTNNAGQISDANKLPNNALFGPYIKTPPQNPLTKSSEILVVNSIPDNFKSPGSYGFIFD